MGAARGRPEPPVRDTLAAEGHRFEFHQAVRLLEMLHALRAREAEAAGKAPPPAEAVRFRSSASLAFPTSAVEEVRLPENGRDPAEVKVSFLGLAGVLGPLPQPFSELVLERAARGDHALREFLDVFHHRLVKLLADARRKSRLALQTSSPEQGGMAGRLLAVAGMGTEGLQGRLRVPDRALLRYAGLLSQHPRSMAGLEGVLRAHFGVGVRGVQMVGRWLPLGERQTTRLGRSGQNRKLGQGAVLGERVWDPQGAFELRLGPLSREELFRFLPGTGSAWRPLCELTRLYAGPGLDFTVRPVVRAAEVPESRLGGKEPPRLGWTSWLRTRDFAKDDEQVRLSP